MLTLKARRAGIREDWLSQTRKQNQIQKHTTKATNGVISVNKGAAGLAGQNQKHTTKATNAVISVNNGAAGLAGVAGLAGLTGLVHLQRVLVLMGQDLSP